MRGLSGRRLDTGELVAGQVHPQGGRQQASLEQQAQVFSGLRSGGDQDSGA